MGNINEKMYFDHNAHNLPKGKDSVRGLNSELRINFVYRMCT